MSYGFASNLRDALPNASFIGFTGTPIEKTDANTRTVFGDYISMYDIQRAVADESTKPIYYESRIAKLALNAAELPKLDGEKREAARHQADAARAGRGRFGGVFRPGGLDGGEDHLQQIRPRAPAPTRARRGARFRSPEGERK